MALKYLILKITNEEIFLNPRLSISIRETNIPGHYLTFSEREEIYWKVEQLGFDAKEKELRIRVDEYKTRDISNFDIQNPQKQITRILFEKFDWLKLEPLLTSYRKIGLDVVLFNMNERPFSYSPKQETGRRKARSDHKFTYDDELISYERSEWEVSDQIWVYFRHTKFILHGIKFGGRVKGVNKKIEFTILNKHILAEFDYIKHWFSKVLKTSRFKAEVKIKLANQGIIKASATSSLIDQITPQIIDSIKYQRTLDLTKKATSNEKGKALFEADEIFSQFDSNVEETNVFNQTEEEIFNFLLKNANVAHKPHLEYLASKKQSDKFNIRYTLQPNFGFLFLVEGDDNYHFIWELLKSHATYIWSAAKTHRNLNIIYDQIERIINTINDIGRNSYKQRVKENVKNENVNFTFINHSGIDSNKVDDFAKWKRKIDTLES